MVVDKSVAIRDIMNHERSVIVGLCPRRMGKSLFLGLLADFLAAVSRTPYGERRAWYEEYAIYQEDPVFFNNNMGHYAVFKLDLKRLRVHRQYVSYVINAYDGLMNRRLNAASMAGIGDLVPALMCVFFLLFKRKAVVVVDGCDAPFLNILCGVEDLNLRTELTKDYNRFLGKIFEGRRHLHKGILVGVFDVRSSSIESVFNNIATFFPHTRCTDRKPHPFQRAFGFTLQDVWAVIDRYVNRHWPARKRCTDVGRFKARVFAGLLLQSDGYRIGTVRWIFCPLAVMTFMGTLDLVATDKELAFDNLRFWCATGPLEMFRPIKTESVSGMERYLRHLVTEFDWQRELQRTSDTATRLWNGESLDDDEVARIASRPWKRYKFGHGGNTDAELARICTVDSSGLVDELLDGGRFSAVTAVQLFYQMGYLTPVSKYRMGIPSKEVFDDISEFHGRLLRQVGTGSNI
ncbi:hypothetical protein IWQ56_003873 [Coemansia nantahalensis]|nr:hypothetical protein IWQ56_003873 [Coemansia nantahalensis]